MLSFESSDVGAGAVDGVGAAVGVACFLGDSNHLWLKRGYFLQQVAARLIVR